MTALQTELASVAAFQEREKAMAVDAVVLQEGITQLQAEMLDQARVTQGDRSAFYSLDCGMAGYRHCV